MSLTLLVLRSEFEWPTWEEVEGVDPSPKVFDEYFSLDPDGEFGLVSVGMCGAWCGGKSGSILVVACSTRALVLHGKLLRVWKLGADKPESLLAARQSITAVVLSVSPQPSRSPCSVLVVPSFPADAPVSAISADSADGAANAVCLSHETALLIRPRITFDNPFYHPALLRLHFSPKRPFHETALLIRPPFSSGSPSH